MKEESIITICSVILVIALWGAFIYGGYQLGRKSAFREIPEVKTDTLIYRDTIRIDKPISVSRIIRDSVIVPVLDTLRDTILVVLPIEQVRWADSLAVVYASGVKVNVDSVIHYSQTKVITDVVTQIRKVHPKWGIGISAGYGVGKSGLSPYVGVGVTYNLLSW